MLRLGFHVCRVSMFDYVKTAKARLWAKRVIANVAWYRHP